MIGFDRIAPLNLRVNGVLLVSKSPHPKYKQRARSGVYVCTHSNTETKKDLLDKVTSRLGLAIVTEVV